MFFTIASQPWSPSVWYLALQHLHLLLLVIFPQYAILAQPVERQISEAAAPITSSSRLKEVTFATLLGWVMDLPETLQMKSLGFHYSCLFHVWDCWLSRKGQSSWAFAKFKKLFKLLWASGRLSLSLFCIHILHHSSHADLLQRESRITTSLGWNWGWALWETGTKHEVDPNSRTLQRLVSAAHIRLISFSSFLQSSFYSSYFLSEAKTTRNTRNWNPFSWLIWYGSQ